MATKRATVKPAPLVPQNHDGGDAWQQVAKTTRPLKKSNVVPQPLAPLPKVFRPEDAIQAAYAKADAKQKAPLPHGRKADKPLPQMDGRLKQRFLRGQIPVDETIDLHGLTLANAERALSRLLRDCIEQQKRCLLVITGKGRSQKDEGSLIPQSRGVLRNWLPDYLRRGPWRDHILGVAPARQEMGGAGAFHVLLRRQRDAGNQA